MTVSELMQELSNKPYYYKVVVPDYDESELYPPDVEVKDVYLDEISHVIRLDWWGYLLVFE